MWIRDVDVPQELVEAHRAGKLVLFVGAGASLDSPSRHIGELRGELRQQLCEHLAAVAVHSDLDHIASGWLRTFTATVDIRTRTDWMDRVAWQLSRLSVEAVEHEWGRWMRRYWQDRLASVPTQLTVDEASAMASWIVYLADSIDEGVMLATAHTARLVERSDLLHDLNGDRLAQKPKAFAELVTHLLRSTLPPFYDCYHLAEVVGVLRQQPDPVELSGIIEQALRLGCTGAADWRP